MATTKTIYVDPDATGTDDGTSWETAYPSLRDAVLAEETNLVTADEVHHFLCRSSNGSADVISQSIEISSSYACDDTCFIIMEQYDSHNGLFDETSYRLEKPTDSSVPYIFHVTHGTKVKILNFQIHAKYQGELGITNNCILLNAITGTYMYSEVAGCLMFGPVYFGLTSPGFYYAIQAMQLEDIANNGNTAEYKITNNVIDGFITGVRTQYNGVAHATVNVHNNTVCNSEDVGFRNYDNYSTTYFYNNITYNNDSYCFRYSYGTADYNATERNVNRGVNGVDLSGYSGPQLFADYTNSNFNLLDSTDNPLIGTGLDLSGNDITTDILGNLRDPNNWDIGAFAYNTLDSTSDPDPEQGESRMKAWDGTSWLSGTLKYYDGTSWEARLIRRFDGTIWEPSV